MPREGSKESTVYEKSASVHPHNLKLWITAMISVYHHKLPEFN